MTVIVPTIKPPKFASEAEEADWYPAHPEYVTELFERARAEGRLVPARVIDPSERTSPVTLRLSQGDLEKARAQAAEKGLGYQTYIKMLLREALTKNEAVAK
jgi:uncharacterized protein (DUF4415 family)